MKLNIGQNLRNLRRSADMTQDELAEKLGVAFQTVSRWENGGSYPDIEMLPVIAGIFDVTVDHLLGTDREKKQKQLDEIIRRLRDAIRARPSEDDTVIEILRELRRDMRLYADCTNSIHLVWHALRWYQGSASPELLEEVRLFHQEYCLYAHTMESLWWPAWAMTVIEDDEHLEEHMKKYCTEKIFTPEELLLDRYSLRGEEENISHAKELCRYLTLRKLFRENPSLTVRDCGMTEYCIAALHLLTGVTPDPEHPVSGDGSLDLWVDIREWLGWQLAELRLDRGDVDGALTVIADVTGLCETLAEEAEKAKKEGRVLELTGRTSILPDFRIRANSSCITFSGDGEERTLPSVNLYYRGLGKNREYESCNSISEGPLLQFLHVCRDHLDDPRFIRLQRRLEALIQSPENESSPAE